MGLADVRNWIGEVFSAFRLNDDDIVVFVVGPSGSGKSTFIRAATQASSLVKVGDTLKPHTKKVQAIRCELQEEARTALRAGERKNIVFVDTPSFHTEEKDGADRKTKNWLKKSRPRCTLFGTIYMHRVETDPNANKESSIQTQLDAFAYTFPEDFIPWAFPERLHCVFSYVDRIDAEKMDDHKEKFRGQLSCLVAKIIHGWKPTWNGSIHPHLFVRGDPNTVWEAVKALFSPPEPQDTGSLARGGDTVTLTGV